MDEISESKRRPIIDAAFYQTSDLLLSKAWVSKEREQNITSVPTIFRTRVA